MKAGRLNGAAGRAQKGAEAREEEICGIADKGDVGKDGRMKASKQQDATGMQAWARHGCSLESELVHLKRSEGIGGEVASKDGAA